MQARRPFLKAMLGLGVGLSSIQSALAWLASGTRSSEAFTLKGEREVLRSLGYPNADPQVSSAIELEAPEIAENGAVVPVDVRSRLANTSRILILVQKNPNTLAADAQFSSRVEPHVALRLKLAETSEVAALIQTPEGWFAARKLVKVTVGGCGG